MRLHVPLACRLLTCLLFASGCLDLGVPPEGAEARPERALDPPSDERACDDAPFAAFAPPPGLLDEAGGCDRAREPYCFALRPELRAVAAEADPRGALDASAAAFDRGDATLARALADLAVSGERAYDAFAARPPTRDALDPNASASARARALQRAYAVAWALRGPAAHRDAARADLGFVAVSPEDDPPARPVNVPAGPFPQRDLVVDVALPSGARAVRTRALTASTASPEATAVDLEAAPPPERWTIDDGPILLFVPGHSSLAEEGAPLAAALVERARARGARLTVLLVDLPSNGYAERVDPAEIIQAFGGADDALLRFHDAFLDAVVAALEAEVPGASARVEAVLGGSLGGNLVLRAGERHAAYARRLVAWSPASIDVSWSRARWPLAAGDGEYVDVVKHEAVRQTRDLSVAAEDGDAREDYFVGGLSSVRNQAGYWYRDGWACKDAMVEDGLRQLGEIYDARFRRWHYRVAFEQLVFSHLEPDADGVRPFTRIEAPLLLVAGDADDSMPMMTRTFVDRLAPFLGMPGATLTLRDTGHALHSERPALLAAEIDAFLDPAGEAGVNSP